MRDFIKITLVANAGVFVEYAGLGFLVDGIHSEGGSPFSPVSSVELGHMREGSGFFKNLDYLLFTHDHPDHFSPRLVADHIGERPAKGLFLPGETRSSADHGRLFDRLQERGIPYWAVGLEPGKTQCFILADDVTLTLLGASHMGPQYARIRNTCFLLTLGGKNLLFTGDADPVEQDFGFALKEEVVDVAFVNPLFYHYPKGQHVINEVFRPSTLVIYHMPFIHTDTTPLLSMVNRDIQRHGRPDMPVHVFNQEQQSLRLS